MASTEERRKDLRCLLGVPVVIRLPDGQVPVRASVAYISPGGCLIEVRPPIPEGSEVSLAFRLPQHGFCGASGRVVRVVTDASCAVQFSQTNQGLRAFLARFRQARLDARRAVVRDLSKITIEVRTR